VGDVPINETFGVSLYLDPVHPDQIKVNNVWYVSAVNCSYGLLWTVLTPLQPGQSLTLTPATAMGGDYSRWPSPSFAGGSHSLYALVDAWTASGTGTGGLVQETNESDNIRGITFTVP